MHFWKQPAWWKLLRTELGHDEMEQPRKYAIVTFDNFKTWKNPAQGYWRSLCVLFKTKAVRLFLKCQREMPAPIQTAAYVKFAGNLSKYMM